MSNDLDFLYDEDAAVKHIREFISDDIKEKVTDDDITLIIDLMYEYYEESGMIEGDDDSLEIDEEKIVQYIIKALKKDKDAPKLSEENISEIVQGELDYSDTVGLFD